MKTEMEKAKELFVQYCGRHFFMDVDGVRAEYDSYHIPKEIENKWRREYLSQFFKQRKTGKDALRSYSQAIDFMNEDINDDTWERLLFYPFRCDWLDDVTILFMLQRDYYFVEQWINEGRFAKETISEYKNILNGFAQDILKRLREGTLTRDVDYEMNEFSDESYVSSYLEDLQLKWAGFQGR
ncbi:MAG: hypothetical protein IKE33_02170 [Erysipelotrichaceae bacterium]|nr:hypothetical protein [Erysipelotrichaceae bacterium]